MTTLSQRLALLAEPVRIRILALLEQQELVVGELVRILQLPQSTVSRHLKALRTAGWIERRSEGTAPLMHMPAPPADGAELWAVVRAEFVTSDQAAEDHARLEAVLDARAADPSTFFGRMHARWDAIRSELFGESFAMHALLALLPRESVVADLVCGTGALLADLAPWCRGVHGIDRESAMIKAARQRLSEVPNATLWLGGIEDLPLESEVLDAALCTLVLHHIAQIDRALGEVARVLRRDGRAIIVDMQSHDRDEYRRTMGHAHLGFDREHLEQHAEQAGLRLQRWVPLPPSPEALGPPLFLAVLTRRS